MGEKKSVSRTHTYTYYLPQSVSGGINRRAEFVLFFVVAEALTAVVQAVAIIKHHGRRFVFTAATAFPFSLHFVFVFVVIKRIEFFFVFKFFEVFAELFVDFFLRLKRSEWEERSVLFLRFLAPRAVVLSSIKSLLLKFGGDDDDEVF